MPVRVVDANGAELEVSTKEQAQAWVAVGYRIVDESDSGTRKRAASKRAAKKTAAKRSTK